MPFSSRKKPMRVLVNRPDWQQLRISLVGTWKENLMANLRKLKTWVGSVKMAEEDKIRIVLNYLCGTGFRTGRIAHPAISKFRGELSSELRRRKIMKD